MLNFAAVRSWLVEDILIKRLPVSSSFLRRIRWPSANMMDFYVIHGRNPVPGGIFRKTPSKTGAGPCQPVQDFFHQQYCHVSNLDAGAEPPVPWRNAQWISILPLMVQKSSEKTHNGMVLKPCKLMGKPYQPQLVNSPDFLHQQLFRPTSRYFEFCKAFLVSQFTGKSQVHRKSDFTFAPTECFKNQANHWNSGPSNQPEPQILWDIHYGWWKKSHYLQGFIHPQWLFGISSINRSTKLK